MNTKTKVRWTLGLAVGAVALLSAAGCQKENRGYATHGEDFVPDDSARAIHDVVEMQAANSARADATLRPQHFDGPMLNSLGEERLELILRNGDLVAPLTLYLDLPADATDTNRRQQTVVAYLKDRGLVDEQIQVKSGANPNYKTSAATLLAPPPGAASAQPSAVMAPTK